MPILLRTQRLIDGTGAPERAADALIDDDRIVAVDDRIDPPPDTETIDLGDLVLSPGFIDAHGHSDFTSMLYPDAAGRLHDGVTAEVTGNCGFAAFPLAGEVLEKRRTASTELPVPVDWHDLQGYAAAAERIGCAIHRIPLIGQGNIRGSVVGYADREATGEEIERMAALVAEAMRQGAHGMSTGLIYPPGICTPTDELERMVAEVALWGGVHTSHMRSESDAVEEAIDEHLGIARRTGVRTVISHLKITRRHNWQKLDWLERTLAEARAEGVDLYADLYPYEASWTDLDQVLPTWAIRGRDPLEVIRDEAGRRRVIETMRAEITDPWDYFAAVQLCRTTSERYKGATGRRVAEVAREIGEDPIDLAVDIIDAENDDIGACFFRIDPDGMRRIARWPFVMFGSDSSLRSLEGGAEFGYVHPRCFGAHATVLGTLVREEGVLALPEAVRKMTSLVADVFGLEDRGRIAPGLVADLTAFDPEAIEPGATWTDPCQYSRGVAHAMVAGRWALRDGRLTGQRPGRVLRRRQSQ